jgi:membrane protein YdbS with pleckstrin-like domain
VHECARWQRSFHAQQRRSPHETIVLDQRVRSPEHLETEGSVTIDDYVIGVQGKRSADFSPQGLVGWTVRTPTEQMRQWALLSGLAHGLVWAFPFVAAALVWRLASGSDGNPLWPALLFSIGIVLLIIFLIKGILVPRTWWFAYTQEELIVEHGLLFKARDHIAFDRVQYLERRAGPFMRPRKIASIGFETAAGRAVVPAAELPDVAVIEEHVRLAMQRAAVV